MRTTVPEAFMVEMVKFVLARAWCKVTASPSSAEGWSQERPAFGQCAVSALLVQELLGGELLRTVVEGFGSHYYNKLPSGTIVDLTRSQFPEGTVVPDGELVDTNRVLSSERAIEAQTQERYDLLFERYQDIRGSVLNTARLVPQ